MWPAILKSPAFINVVSQTCPFCPPHLHSAAPLTQAPTWTWLKETCRTLRSFCSCTRWSSPWFPCPTSWRTTCASLMWRWMWCRGKTCCFTSYTWLLVGFWHFEWLLRACLAKSVGFSHMQTICVYTLYILLFFFIIGIILGVLHLSAVIRRWVMGLYINT